MITALQWLTSITDHWLLNGKLKENNLAGKEKREQGSTFPEEKGHGTEKSVGRGSQIHHYPSKLWFKKLSTISISQLIHPEWAIENEAINIAQSLIICRNRQAPMSWEALSIDLTCPRTIYVHISQGHTLSPDSMPSKIDHTATFQIGDESVGKVDSLSFPLQWLTLQREKTHCSQVGSHLVQLH